jgi:class 3 adenylate cyclase
MSDLRVLGTISLSGSWALVESRRKLLRMLAALEPDKTRIIPFISSLSDAIRWYRQWGKKPHMELIFQPPVPGRRSPPRLLFRLRVNALDKPLPQHLLRHRFDAAMVDLSTEQGSSVDPAGPSSAVQEIKGFPLARRPSDAELQACATVFTELSKDELFEAVQQEKAKSEELVRNILPDKIALALKEQTGNAGTIFDFHPATTILFTDEVGFTPLTSTLTPERIVRLIDHLFSRFDELCGIHGVEKIKTIGDAYLAVAGVPSAVEDHARRAARLALDIRRVHSEVMAAEGVALKIRIGLHSGPVVAGVIGSRKYAYDIWGDSVNVASRMESTSLPNEIHISAATRKLLPEGFMVQSRGEVAIKGRGTMESYFLNSFSPVRAGRPVVSTAMATPLDDAAAAGPT